MADALPLNRRATPPDDRDFFPTPPWATRALCEALEARGLLAGASVWEPACGEGYMSRPLAEYFAAVRSTDLVDCSELFEGFDGVLDFLLDWPEPGRPASADWIITNPPFNRAEEFFELAWRRARIGVAFFLKQQWLEGLGRYRAIYARRPPSLILQFAERVPLKRGEVDPEARTNQAYLWIIWIKPEAAGPVPAGRLPTEFGWIGPCRKRLERPSDYPPRPPAEPPAPTEFLALMGEQPAATPAHSEESKT